MVVQGGRIYGREEGEISDEEDGHSQRAYESGELGSHSSCRAASSVSYEQETEVDRIISEFQREYDLQDEDDAGHERLITASEDDDSDADVEALRLAAIRSAMSRKAPAVARLPADIDDDLEDGELIDRHQKKSAFATDSSRRGPHHSASRGHVQELSSDNACKWVPLEESRLRENRGNKRFEASVKRRSKPLSKKLMATPTSSQWVPINSTGAEKSAGGKEMNAKHDVERSSLLDFADALRNIRQSVEASSFDEGANNEEREEVLHDNYEQVVMDIEDSDDRDSRSRSGLPAAGTLALNCQRTAESMGDGSGNHRQRNASIVDNDEDMELLRAVLLEQVKKNRGESRRGSPSNHLEEGEIQSGRSSITTVTFDGTGQGPSNVEKDCSIAAKSTNATIQPDGSRSHSSRRFQRGSKEKGNTSRCYTRTRDIKSPQPRDPKGIPDDASDDTDEFYGPPRKRRRREKRELGSRRTDSHAEPRRRCDSESPEPMSKTSIEWEKLIKGMKSELSKVEGKIKHREVQREITIKKGERFLRKYNNCAHQIGIFEGELVYYRAEREKLMSQLEFFERERERAKSVERETRRKISGREKEHRRKKEVEKEKVVARNEEQPDPAGAARYIQPATGAPASTLASSFGAQTTRSHYWNEVDVEEDAAESHLHDGEESPLEDEQIEFDEETDLGDFEECPEEDEDAGEEDEEEETANDDEGLRENKTPNQERSNFTTVGTDENLREISEGVIVDLTSDSEGTSQQQVDETLQHLKRDPDDIKPPLLRFVREGTIELSSDSEGESPTCSETVRSGQGNKINVLSRRNKLQELGNDENENPAEGANLHLEPGGLREDQENVIPTDREIAELRDNPLIMFSGYRLCPTFPFRFLTHRAISNNLDPLRSLCPYELTGKCKDYTCRFQHETDYVMSDTALLCSILVHYPPLCPPKKMFSEYAKELLEQEPKKSVVELAAFLLEKIPDSERKITACEMAAKCDVPIDRNHVENYEVDYEIADQQRPLSKNMRFYSPAASGE